MLVEVPPTMSTVREEIHKLADQLPADATWDDAMYALYVRQKIEAGREAIAEGRFVTQEQLEQQIAEWRDK
jgi:predicted transcriptional regulator